MLQIDHNPHWQRRYYLGFPTALALISAAIVSGHGANAAERPAKLLTALSVCRAEHDDAKRLACYDAAVSPLEAAVASGDVKVVDREDMRQTRRSLFGFQLPRLPFFGGDDSMKDTPKEIDTTLAAARGIGVDNFQLTMADGAVWNTTEPLPRDPRPGMAVKLTQGAFGNYFVHVGPLRAVRAVRVK